MPFELAVLVLPLVLHPTTRNRLPPKITTTLPTWVAITGIFSSSSLNR